jgi:hypothetical protein
VLPTAGLAQNVVYDAIGLLSSAVMLAAVRLHRPARAGAWYLFAAGQIVWVVGDVVYSYLTFALHQEPYPSVADVFYLSAYPLLGAGFYLLVRGRAAGRDLAGLVDAAVVGTGVGLVFWVFVIVPIAGDASLSGAAAGLQRRLPVADVVLLAMLARLWTTPGARAGSFRLLLVAGALLLGADVGFSVVTSCRRTTAARSTPAGCSPTSRGARRRCTRRCGRWPSSAQPTRPGSAAAGSPFSPPVRCSPPACCSCRASSTRGRSTGSRSGWPPSCCSCWC